jgi:tetratricopeptide (TPR) repeat protein
VIWNSDQGSHFTSPQYRALLLAADVQISMDGKGRALDNVFVERLWRSLKYEERGMPADVEQMYEEANAIARAWGDQLTDLAARNGLGAIATAALRLDEAAYWYQRTLQSAREFGTPLQVTMLLTNLGFTTDRLGDPAAAQQYHEEALALGRSLGVHAFGTAVQLNALVGHLACALPS